MKHKIGHVASADPAADPSAKPPAASDLWSKPSVLELSVSDRTRQGKNLHYYENETSTYRPQS